MSFLRHSRFILLAVILTVVPATMLADVYISAGAPPPPLPVYAQPPCPAPGYMWTPGYWSYGPYGYYWVPGTWVMAPQPGYLWTPGYWAWDGYRDAYVWYPGYWAPQVGYYGGINYGYGYPGNGYYGGYWQGRQFYYNRAVNNVTIRNVRMYDRQVVNNVNVTRVSYNGGHGGVYARPTPEQQTILRERHLTATSNQLEHEQLAREDQSLRATVNHGAPTVAATPRPATFHGNGVVAARNAAVNVPATTSQPGNVARPNENARPNTSGMYGAHPTSNNTPRPPEREDNAVAPHPVNPAVHGNVGTPHPQAAPPNENGAVTPHAITPATPHATPAAPEPHNPAVHTAPAPEPYHGAAPPHVNQPPTPRSETPHAAAPQPHTMPSQPAPHVSAPPPPAAHPPTPR